MFAERNKNLRKPDKNGEYFFDRSYVTFEIISSEFFYYLIIFDRRYILNYLRTGDIHIPPDMNRSALKQEFDFWQIPASLKKEEKLGISFKHISLQYWQISRR